MVETPKKIILKGADKAVYKEGNAGGAITPGHLVKRNSSDAIVVHATAAGNAVPMFAVENDLFGKGISDAYASNDLVQCVIPQRGGEIYALIKESSAAVVIGDYLESAGDGTLKKQATDAATDDTQRASTVAIALEPVTPGGSPGRIKIEVL